VQLPKAPGNDKNIAYPETVSCPAKRLGFGHSSKLPDPRWQLAWASWHSLLFMFTDGAGKYKSMTRSMLDKMAAVGALRLMSQTVLEDALDAVAQMATRNSMDNAS
jgi:hypothetical protein